MMMAAENSVEDYWEDASVSWGCRGLSLPSLSLTQQAHRDGPVIPKQDFHITSTLRPRNFPPPITLCTTLSIKAGGRFVLKEMASLPLHCFRAEREQGRLCLHLIEPKDSDSDSDSDEEEEEEEEEEDCYSNYDNLCNVEDPSVCAPHLHHQPDGYATETINENIMNHEQTKHTWNQGMSQELEEAVVEETDDTQERHACTREASPSEMNALEHTQEASTSKKNATEHIDTRDISCGGCCIPTSIVCANDIQNKNEGGAYMGMLGIGQHRFRKTEGSNDISASFSPCASKQVLSFARTSPPLGLAVS